MISTVVLGFSMYRIIEDPSDCTPQNLMSIVISLWMPSPTAILGKVENEKD